MCVFTGGNYTGKEKNDNVAANKDENLFNENTEKLCGLGILLSSKPHFAVIGKMGLRYSPHLIHIKISDHSSLMVISGRSP